MFNLQGSEIIVILLLALVVLGPEKLPDAVRKFSQTYNELKKMGSGFQSELKSVIDEPMREVRNTADMIRDAADPSKAASDAPGRPTDTPTADTPDTDTPTTDAPTTDRPERPSTPVVAPPPPFASSATLGTELPGPTGEPESDLAPPPLNGRKVNGQHRERSTDAADRIPPPPRATPSVPPPPPPPR